MIYIYINKKVQTDFATISLSDPAIYNVDFNHRDYVITGCDEGSQVLLYNLIKRTTSKIVLYYNKDNVSSEIMSLFPVVVKDGISIDHSPENIGAIDTYNNAYDNAKINPIQHLHFNRIKSSKIVVKKKILRTYFL